MTKIVKSIELTLAQIARLQALVHQDTSSRIWDKHAFAELDENQMHLNTNTALANILAQARKEINEELEKT